jgi:hypothetical protein
VVVSPRGSSTAAAPGLAPAEIGRRWSGKNRAAAKSVGIVVKRNSGLALTSERVLTMGLQISLTGAIKEVRTCSASSRSTRSTRSTASGTC